MVFLSGSREGNTVSSQTAGLFDLTADGTQIFLNAVEYMLHPEPYKVVWVTFHPTNLPSANAAAANRGFTNAPDAGYTDLLTANGYNVTRYLTTGTPDPAVLNAADVVIIGRSVNSGNYQNAGATTWNNVTVPIINMAGYTLRNNRLGFVTASTTPVDTTGNVTLTVSDPTHFIFHGIPLTSGTMDNPFAGLAMYPDSAAPAPRGISINPDPANAGGTVLATVSAAGNGPVGSMVIGEWQAGTVLTHLGGDLSDSLGGPRLVFLSGSREGDTVNSETAGIFDLTADGAQMFLNTVRYAASRRGAAPVADLLIESVVVVGGNQLQLTVTGGTGSFIVQKKTSLSDPNWTNISTNSGSTVLVPIEAGNGFFRLEAQ
jgi:hypothetical protein